MRAVNLLPRDTGSRRHADPLAVVGAGGGAVVLAALAFATISASGPLGDKREAIAEVEARLGLVAQPMVGDQAENAVLAAEQEKRSAALEAALATRVSWDRVLRRFSLVIPDDVWLTALSATGSTGVPTETGAPTTQTVFQIQGYTYSHQAVARLLARLAVVPDLENVQLQRSALAPLEGRQVVEFSIAAGIRGGAKT
jgi:Tfp pilus assembly protein PilN